MILSVVIPTMNKRELLARTIGALRRQQLSPTVEWEIVVVDDGSTDGTGSWLSSQAGQGAPRLTVVSPGSNVGRARARNLGVQAARGTWVLFLDDDIVAPPDLLSAHLELLKEDPGCGTIGPAITAPELFDAPHHHYLDTRGVARLGPGPAPARYFVTQNAAVPRAAFLAVGGFDELFVAYGFEDMELAFRLEDRAAVRFRCLPNPVPLHVHHHSLDEYVAKRIECGRRSLARLAALHPGRLPEMSLHHVIDGPVASPPGLFTRVFRWFAVSPWGKRLPRCMGQWPADRRHRPRCFRLYCTLMNLMVLSCYRQGVTKADANSCN